MLPFLIALPLGLLAAWGINLLLDPKPLFEVQLKENEGAILHLGSLLVFTPGNGVTIYNLKNGEGFNIDESKYYTPISEIEPKLKRTTGKDNSLSREPYVYLARPPKPDPSRQTPYVCVDPLTKRFQPFHGYDEDDRFSTLFGNIYKRSSSCVIRCPLPLNAVLSDAFMPMQSPASLMLGHVSQLTTCSTPYLYSITSIPKKQIVSQFVLDGGWSDAQITISPNGLFVICTRSDASIAKEAFEGMKFSCFWDVHKECWMTNLPEVSRYAHKSPAEFINDDLYVVQSPQSAGSFASDNFDLLNITTGQPLDKLHGISENYFVMKQVMKSDDGSLWYLKRSNGNNSRLTYELKRIKNSSEVESIDKYSWDHAEVGVALTQGLQSIVPNDGQTTLSKFIKDKMGTGVFFKAVEPWIIRPSTSIYDWKSGRTYPGWTGDHRWQISPDSKYLLIVHQISTEKQTKQGTLAQVFQMPLTFYSPWWNKITGTFIAVLIFIFLWRRQTRKLPKPTP
ncbi:MAG: hypothetical protein QM703_09875 [Gemmatales bacterium]